MSSNLNNSGTSIFGKTELQENLQSGTGDIVTATVSVSDKLTVKGPLSTGSYDVTNSTNASGTFDLPTIQSSINNKVNKTGDIMTGPLTNTQLNINNPVPLILMKDTDALNKNTTNGSIQIRDQNNLPAMALAHSNAYTFLWNHGTGGIGLINDPDAKDMRMVLDANTDSLRLSNTLSVDLGTAQIKSGSIDDTTIVHPNLGASEVLTTNLTKNIISEVKGNAFNTNFGTAFGSVVDGGEYLAFTQQKGAVNGLCDLDGDSLVPLSRLPAGVSNSVLRSGDSMTGDLVMTDNKILDVNQITYGSATTGIDIYNSVDAHVLKPNASTSPPINGYLPTIPLTISSTTASASTNPIDAWKAFDNDNTWGWLSASNYNGGSYTGSGFTTLANTTQLFGDWLQFEFDNLLTVNGWSHYIPSQYGRLKDLSVVWSDDNINWYLIENSINNLMTSPSTYYRTFTNPPSGVKYIRIIVHSITFTNQQWYVMSDVKFDCSYVGTATTTIKKLDVQMDLQCDNLITSGLVDGFDVSVIGPLANNSLQKSGDTSTGNITIDKLEPRLIMNDSGSNDLNAIEFQNIGVTTSYIGHQDSEYQGLGLITKNPTNRISVFTNNDVLPKGFKIDPLLSTIALSNVDIDMNNNDVLNIGANGYNLNAHLVDSSIHFTKGSILHSNIQQIGLNSHDDIDTFITNTGINLNNRLLKAGDTMSGILNMNQNRIDNVSLMYANSANFGIENSSATGSIYLQASSEGTTNTLTLNPSTAKMTVTNMDLDMSNNNIVNCNIVKTTDIESSGVGGTIKIGYADASSIQIGKLNYTSTIRGNMQVNGTSFLQSMRATAVTVSNTSPSIIFKDTRTGIQNVQGGFAFTDTTDALCSQILQSGLNNGDMVIETFYPTSEITLQTAGGAHSARLGSDTFRLAGVDLDVAGNGIQIGNNPHITYTDIRNNTLNIESHNLTLTDPVPNGSVEYPYSNIDSVPYAGTIASSTQIGNALQTLYDPSIAGTWWFCALTKYASSDGAYIGTQVNNYDGGSVNGEYLQYKFVKKMSLQNVRIKSYGSAFNPVSMTILGSNDGTNFKFIQSFTGMTYPAGDFVWGNKLDIVGPQKYAKYNTYKFVYQSTNGGDPGYERVSVVRTQFGFLSNTSIITDINTNLGLIVKEVVQDTQRSYITKLQWTSTAYLFNPTTTNVYEPFHPIGTAITGNILVPIDDATYIDNREIVIGAGGGGYYQINGACSFSLAQNGDLVTTMAISKNAGSDHYCAQAIFNNKEAESLSVACSTIALLVPGDTLRLEMKTTNAIGDNLYISSWCLAVHRIPLNI